MQVDKYKSLLLKQRDIMIALTARLNERDEQILTLQEELEAYDSHQRKLEDKADRSHNALLQLRGTLVRLLDQHKDGISAPAARAISALTDLSQDELGGDAAGSVPPLKGLSLGERAGPGGIRGTMEVTDMAGSEPPQSARSDAPSMAGRPDSASSELLQRDVREMKDVLAKSEKERDALKAIMGDKMRALVQEMDQEIRGLALPSDSRLAKQIKVLDKLLSATVQAMTRSDVSARSAQLTSGRP